jgi:hypothetical protein
MKNLIGALCLSLAAGVFAFGQTTTVDDYKKGEGYVGYSNGQVDTGADSGNSVNDFFEDRRNFHGFNVSGVYNVSRYFGVKGDMSATFNSDRFTGTVSQPGGDVVISAKTSNQLYNFVGGVQVKDNSRSGVFKPFAHAMVGLAHSRNKTTDFTCTPTIACGTIIIPATDNTFTSNDFSGVFGGGIDFRVSDRFQIRAIQVDYNPIGIFNGRTDHNLRLGAGIVF